MKIILYNDYNSRIVRGGVIGTVLPSFGILSFRAGWKLIEVYESDKSTKEIDKK